MARFSKIQNTFLAGELSPRAYGRTDIPEYQQGCKTLKNAIPYPQGGAGNRPGFQFHSLGPNVFSAMNDETPADLGGATWSKWTTDTTLFPFKFSRTEKFIFVFDKHTNGLGFLGQIRAINADTGTQYNVPMLAALESLGYSFDFTNVTDLREIQWAQSGDYTFFVHKNMEPFYIVRTAATTFYAGLWWYPHPFPATSSTVLRAEAQPFREINNTTASLKVSAVTANTSITLTIAAGANFAFTASHVGATFWFTDSGTGGYTTVTAFGSSTSVTATNGPVALPAAVAAGSGVTTWFESAWSLERGWPRTVTLYDQRLVFGGNKSEPFKIWNTRKGNYFKFTDSTIDLLLVTTTASAVDAFNFTIFSDDANEIQWLASKKSLIVGTSGHEFTVKPNDTGYSRGNVSTQSESTHGSIYVKPVQLESAVAFIGGSGQRLQELSYTLQEDTFRCTDLTLLAEHIPKKSQALYATISKAQIKQVVHQEHENGILWMVDNNGLLSGTTRNKQREVNAWHWHQLGGLLSSEPTKVKCIASVPSPTGDNDDLWAVVNRTVNSASVFYIERMGKDFDFSALATASANIENQPIYVDSAKLVSAPGSTTVSGFTHLEGQSIAVVSDGIYIGAFTVSGGAVNLSSVLSSNPSKVIGGLAYTPVIEPLFVEAGSQIGSASGSPKKFDKIKIRFFETAGAKYGDSTSDLIDIQIRPATTAATTPTPLFTGLKVLDAPAKYAEDLSIVVSSATPLPLRIAAIILRGITSD